jgi:hypothetical protein
MAPFTYYDTYEHRSIFKLTMTLIFVCKELSTAHIDLAPLLAAEKVTNFTLTFLVRR